MWDSIRGRSVQTGDIVRIVRGPFAGLSGSFVSLSGQRALVVIAISGRRLDVEIDIGWVDVTLPRRRSASSVEAAEVRRRSNS
jgi:hypothetical protein